MDSPDATIIPLHARRSGALVVPARAGRRFETGAWVGLGLLGASFLVRLWVFRRVDTAGDAPALFFVGWPLVAALFPGGLVGALLLVGQAAVIAGGIAIGARSGWFTDHAGFVPQACLVLQVGGLASAIPLAVLVAVVTVNLLLLLLIGLAVLASLRLLAAIVG